MLLIALQTEKVELTDNVQFTFYGLFKENLTTAIESLDYTDQVEAAYHEVMQQTSNQLVEVLELKQKLGLFENPYRGANEQLEKDVIYSEEHLQVDCIWFINYDRFCLFIPTYLHGLL